MLAPGQPQPQPNHSAAGPAQRGCAFQARDNGLVEKINARLTKRAVKRHFITHFDNEFSLLLDDRPIFTRARVHDAIARCANSIRQKYFWSIWP